MTLVTEHSNPLAVLDAVIADMRASGDTGHVENLLRVREDVADLISVAQDAHDNYFKSEGDEQSVARAALRILSRIGATS